MMRIVHTITCDLAVCSETIEATRPIARVAGWNCDTRLGIDFCPAHARHGSNVRERGTCAFCGKSSAIKNNGRPVLHDVPGITPVVRCPGIHQQVIRGQRGVVAPRRHGRAPGMVLVGVSHRRMDHQWITNHSTHHRMRLPRSSSPSI